MKGFATVRPTYSHPKRVKINTFSAAVPDGMKYFNTVDEFDFIMVNEDYSGSCTEYEDALFSLNVMTTGRIENGELLWRKGNAFVEAKFADLLKSVLEKNDIYGAQVHASHPTEDIVVAYAVSKESGSEKPFWRQYTYLMAQGDAVYNGSIYFNGVEIDVSVTDAVVREWFERLECISDEVQEAGQDILKEQGSDSPAVVMDEGDAVEILQADLSENDSLVYRDAVDLKLTFSNGKSLMLYYKYTVLQQREQEIFDIDQREPYRIGFTEYKEDHTVLQNGQIDAEAYLSDFVSCHSVLIGDIIKAGTVEEVYKILVDTIEIHESDMMIDDEMVSIRNTGTLGKGASDKEQAIDYPVFKENVRQILMNNMQTLEDIMAISWKRSEIPDLFGMWTIDGVMADVFSNKLRNKIKRKMHRFKDDQERIITALKDIRELKLFDENGVEMIVDLYAKDLKELVGNKKNAFIIRQKWKKGEKIWFDIEFYEETWLASRKR